MTDAQIKQANILKEKIKDIEYFLKVADPEKDVKRGSGYWDITALIKKKVTTRFRLFACRWIGMGHLQEEISIPNELLVVIHREVSNYLETIKKELEDL